MSLIIPSIDSTNISNINNTKINYSIVARETNRDWSSIASDSTGTKLAASVNAGQIYTSTDSGLTWTPRENNRFWYDIASNSDGTILVAILILGTQVYISTDSGLNWTARTVTASNKDWRSVAINSTGTIMAAVAAFDANVYVSTNSGLTWVARGTGAPGTPDFESIAMNSSGTIMITSDFGGRLYVSTDSGTTWTNRDSDRGWLSVASNNSGDNLFAVAFGGLDGFVYRSTDFGVTWVAQMTDAPRNWFYIASNSTGRRLIALIGARGAPSQLYISIDSGVSWVVRESTRNWMEGTPNSDGTKFFAVASSDKIYMIALSNSFITIGNSFMNALGENNDNISVAYIPSAAISATNAMTTVNYSSLCIEGAPVLSTNVTGTNPYALNVGSGNSIFGGSVNITPTTNQLVLGTTNRTTISATAPAASRTYTMPDAGGNANFILSTSGSGQTIAGGLTSSGVSTFSGTGNTAIASSSVYVNPSTTTVSGTNSNVFFSSFASPPLTVSSGTTTNASTLYIAGAPTKSGAGTLTNAYALNVNSGGSVFGGPIKGNASLNGINESVLICPNAESTTATTTLQLVPSSTTPWTGGVAQIIMGDATHSIRNQFAGDSSGRMEFIDINGFQFRRTTAVTAHTTVSDTGNWSFLNTTQSTSATTGAINVRGGIGMGSGVGSDPPPIINWGGAYTGTRKLIALYDTSNSNTDFQYYGFGTSSSQFDYTVSGTGASHVFYAGTGAATRTELARITGGGALSFGRIQTNSPSQTVIYYTPPSFANQINPHYAIYTKIYSFSTAQIPLPIFSFTGGTSNPNTSFLSQIFSLHVSGGQQNVGGWCASFNFSINGSGPTLGTVVQTYNGGGGLSLSAVSGGTFILNLRLNIANTSNVGNVAVTLTVYPAFGIDEGGSRMYTIIQL